MSGDDSGADPEYKVETISGSPHGDKWTARVVRKEKVEMAETTVLEDPIENQNLIRMRAKWAAQRADVVVARFEAKEEAGTLTPEDRKAFTAAKKAAAAAWKVQERELKALRKMREAQKKASSPAETAVA